MTAYTSSYTHQTSPQWVITSPPPHPPIVDGMPEFQAGDTLTIVFTDATHPDDIRLTFTNKDDDRHRSKLKTPFKNYNKGHDHSPYSYSSGNILTFDKDKDCNQARWTFNPEYTTTSGDPGNTANDPELQVGPGIPGDGHSDE